MVRTAHLVFENKVFIYVHVCSVVSNFASPQTIACQDFFSVPGVAQEEYWSGLLFPSPGYLPKPGIKPVSPALTGDSLLLSHQRRLFLSTCIIN